MVGIFLIAFLYRFKGILHELPFWIDEFSTAQQAGFILSKGLNVLNSINKPPLYFENRNFTEHLLVAFSFSAFGVTEWAARIPSVLTGAMVPVVAYLLGRILFSSTTGLVTSLMIAFSYYEIAWSRQARGYMLQQLFGLLAFYFYSRMITKKFNAITFIVFNAVIILGLLTHPLYILVPIAIAVDFFGRSKVTQRFLRSKKILAVLTLFFLTLFASANGYLKYVVCMMGTTNNVWYYHSFLWRDYGVITLLMASGIFIGLIKKNRSIILIVSYLLLHLISVSFLIGPYTTRYINPIMPFIFVLAGFGLTQVTQLILKDVDRRQYKFLAQILPIAFVILIILNGDKFTIKPKSYYSVNHDFREIAVIDYKRIYALIESKGELEKRNTAVIDTWPDRTFWYLGRKIRPFYLLQWSDKKTINGIETGTSSFFVNQNGEKRSMAFPDWGYVNSLLDLKKAMSTYPKGFIFIDDSSLPHDVIEYAQKHLKKELYLDHYPLDDNPYSIWPATLYSWGIDK